MLLGGRRWEECPVKPLTDKQESPYQMGCKGWDCRQVRFDGGEASEGAAGTSVPLGRGRGSEVVVERPAPAPPKPRPGPPRPS